MEVTRRGATVARWAQGHGRPRRTGRLVAGALLAGIFAVGLVACGSTFKGSITLSVSSGPVGTVVSISGDAGKGSGNIGCSGMPAALLPGRSACLL